MRVKLIENKSDDPMNVNCYGGTSVMLLPGQSAKDLDVSNIDEVVSRAKITYDLTEVMDR
jgi:hypothetical protein